MKTIVSEDKQVTKYIHEDGSETCIKTVLSLDTVNNDAGEPELKATDRNKYSVFVSPSCGCPLNCSFCYLTIDHVPFKKVPSIELEINLTQAIKQRIEMEPSIKERYVKICWMGMGEAILRPIQVASVTTRMLDKLLDWKWTKGLDGVDISTVLPNVNDQWMDEFLAMNKVLTTYPLNPNNRKADNVGPDSNLVTYDNRSVFRVFYSLHSAVQDTRDRIIPGAMDLVNAAPRLQTMQDQGVDVIFHHMFLDGVNDDEYELESLAKFMEQFPDNELRILRYNAHEDSDIKESDAFKECMCYIGERHGKIKVQVSQGGAVRSACGQFVYNNEHRVAQYAKLDVLE